MKLPQFDEEVFDKSGILVYDRTHNCIAHCTGCDGGK